MSLAMTWEDIARQAAEHGVPGRLPAMEAIHLCLLQALYADRRSVDLVFHGGTCIRLGHGGYRYSEDLDFICSGLADDVLIALMERAAGRAGLNLLPYLGPGTSGLQCKHRPGKRSAATWWFRFAPQGTREILRVKIEVGRYPARDPGPLPLLPAWPPVGPKPLVMAASARELLADKINALAQRGYVRGRDLFDIWFLRQVKCVPVDRDLVALKFADYGTGRPLEVLAQRRSQLDPGLIASEMERFLPLTARRLLAADGHAGVMAAVAEVLAEVLA